MRMRPNTLRQDLQFNLHSLTIFTFIHVREITVSVGHEWVFFNYLMSFVLTCSRQLTPMPQRISANLSEELTVGNLLYLTDQRSQWVVVFRLILFQFILNEDFITCNHVAVITNVWIWKLPCPSHFMVLSKEFCLLVNCALTTVVEKVVISMNIILL